MLEDIGEIAGEDRVVLEGVDSSAAEIRDLWSLVFRSPAPKSQGSVRKSITAAARPDSQNLPASLHAFTVGNG